MNYPLRNGILALLIHGDAEFLADVLKSVYSTYPKTVSDSLMNLLGTHDTERILTVLGEGSEENSREPNSVLARKTMCPAKRQIATAKLMFAALIQYTVYGVPSVFYGDEAGLEGYHDPFCRKPYPWNDQDETILDFYKKLGQIRLEHNELFAEGDFFVNFAESSFISYSRKNKCEEIIVAVNASDEPQEYHLHGKHVDLITGKEYGGTVSANCGVILKKINNKK